MSFRAVGFGTVVFRARDARLRVPQFATTSNAFCFTSRSSLNDYGPHIPFDMARTNGLHAVNGFHPPPSSILATRVGNGDDALEFNQDSFHQLLEESLGTDDNGQPNLGSDQSINHTLICIITKAGIDPFVRDLKDNPFQSNAAPSEREAQVSCCLDVIRTAIDRSPQVIFVKSVPEDHVAGEHQVPLYSWLLPKLLSLLVPIVSQGVRDGVLKVVDGMLTADDNKQGSAAFDFSLGCVTGTVSWLPSKDAANILLSHT